MNSFCVENGIYIKEKEFSGVVNYEDNGTAFYVHPNVLLTAAHVIKPYYSKKRVKVMRAYVPYPDLNEPSPDNKPQKYDLAVVCSDSKKREVYAISSDEIFSDEKITLIGYGKLKYTPTASFRSETFHCRQKSKGQSIVFNRENGLIKFMGSAEGEGIRVESHEVDIPIEGGLAVLASTKSTNDYKNIVHETAIKLFPEMNYSLIRNVRLFPDHHLRFNVDFHVNENSIKRNLEKDTMILPSIERGDSGGPILTYNNQSNRWESHGLMIMHTIPTADSQKNVRINWAIDLHDPEVQRFLTKCADPDIICSGDKDLIQSCDA